MPQHNRLAKRVFIFALFLYIVTWSFIEFENIAWGTGVWLGQLSLKWGIALFLFGLFCVLCLITVWMILWTSQRLAVLFRFLSSGRERLGFLRWLLAVAFLILPVYFLQYTFWGKVLHGPYLRILLAGFASILLAWSLTRGRENLIAWPAVLAALVMVSGIYTLFVSLFPVTSYPFSLGWSEGNRLWDYSVLFGRHLYDYPADKPIPVLLETGRQVVGAVPFLFPHVSIAGVRLWLALVDVIPYLILGWAAYRLHGDYVWRWMLAGVWAYTFVHQGPIHPPLLLCAIVVALVWERPLWLAVPLIVAASLFAEVTRFTWMFAPGMWAAMLELSGAVSRIQQLNKKAWTRAITLGVAGIFGGYIAPFWVPRLFQWAASLAVSASPASAGTVDTVVAPSGVTVAAVNASLSAQPLLWYRLLPNATYGSGILIGLAVAVLPLIAILIYLAVTGRWKLNRWQQLAVVLPLLAFLAVGLIVSVKIGGGGDLHNLDMFILGLMFAGAIAWRRGAYQWIDEIHAAPSWVQVLMVALIAIPGYKSLLLLSPISIRADITTVAALADIHEDPLPNPLPDTLPAEADTQKALATLRRDVARATQSGDVLFMDQRQLLTFGFIKDVPLIPEYDKKVLINQALSENAPYFEVFYQDLASRRFSLIITSPLNMKLDQSEGDFGEENNAWVKWVARPLLCYYQEMDRLKRVNVELLVPRADTSTCDQVLPTRTNP